MNGVRETQIHFSIKRLLMRFNTLQTEVRELKSFKRETQKAFFELKDFWMRFNTLQTEVRELKSFKTLIKEVINHT